MKAKFFTVFSILLGALLGAAPVFAHVVVTPKQVGIASTQVFTLTAQTEKDGGTVTAIKLVLPQGLNFVTPIIKSGWTTTVQTGPIPAGVKPAVADDGDVASSIPTEIDWTGGEIPSGEEAQFLFSAQVPDKSGELDWKAYQTYSDGSIVSWDLGPTQPQPKESSGNLNFDSEGPYSKTMVVNDLTSTSNSNTSQDQGNQAIPLAIIALALSALALGLQLRKRVG